MNFDWPRSRHSTDPEEIARIYASELAPCVKLTAAVPMMATNLNGHPGGSGIHPYAFLDISKRTDLQHLKHKLMRSPDGDVTAAWRFLTGSNIPAQMAILDCRWSTPMVAGFQVAFNLLEHRDFLEAVQKRGHILFSFGGKPGRGITASIRVPITPRELAVIMMMTEPLYRAQVGRN